MPNAPGCRTPSAGSWVGLLGWMVWAWVGLGGLAPVRGVASSVPFQKINGQLRVDLMAWGEREGFKSRWNPGSGSLILTNRSTRMAFKVDTARLELDGVMVWLQWPVIRSGNRPFLSAQDLDAIVNPLLKPTRLPAGKQIRKIAISAGHGGKDPGNTQGVRLEKVYTLKLAREVERRLRAAGFEVVQVRDRDVYVPLEERPARANRANADLYLSLHFNGAAATSGTANGTETYALTPRDGRSTNGGRSSGSQEGNRQDRENLLLAYHIHKKIVGTMGLADHGVRHANFVELRSARMPAVLIEGGFMDHRADGTKIFSDQVRGRLADAIVDGVKAYQRAVQRGGGQ